MHSCPLRARQEERSRVVTVTRGQTVKIPAGRGIGRWWQSMGKVVPQVFDVLASDAEAQEPGREMFLPGQLGPALYGAFYTSEAGGGRDEADGVAYGVGCCRVRQLEAEHGAESVLLRGCAVVAGVIGQARVAHPDDGRVIREAAG